jgi:hypothetical protein
MDISTSLNHQLSNTIITNNLMNDNNNIIESHQQQQYDHEQNNGRMGPPDLSNVYNLKRSEAFFMSDELRLVHFFPSTTIKLILMFKK